MSCAGPIIISYVPLPPDLLFASISSGSVNVVILTVIPYFSSNPFNTPSGKYSDQQITFNSLLPLELPLVDVLVLDPHPTKLVITIAPNIILAINLFNLPLII